MSIDPFLRVLMSMGQGHFLGGVKLGAPLPVRALSEIVESRAAGFKSGDLVIVEQGSQLFAVVAGETAMRAQTGRAPPSTALGILGYPGLAAYFGVTELGAAVPGHHILVSAAAGAAGSAAGQIAALKGARVIGLAGSAEKCAWACRDAGFAACLNYRSDDIQARLRELVPTGLDIYFDNVGGETLKMVIEGRHLAQHARVVLCGLASEYNLQRSPPGVHLGALMESRARVLPIIAYDYQARWDEFLDVVIPWVEDGRIRYREDRSQGLETFAAQFCRLMRGENLGKTLVEIQ